MNAISPPASGRRIKSLSLGHCYIDRFWSKVDKRGEDECWIWKAHVDKDGYGMMWVDGSNVKASRVSFTISNGPIPEGMIVCHSCDVPGCVNPRHLWLGSNLENSRDMVTKGRSPVGERHGSKTHPERVARGDRNGSRIFPERLPRGDQHYSRTNPERLARGDRNGAKTHPESIPKGEAHGRTNLTTSQVISIRRQYSESKATHKELAKAYKTATSTIGRIIRREVWSHVA